MCILCILCTPTYVLSDYMLQTCPKLSHRVPKGPKLFLGIPDARRQMISFLSQTNSIRTCLYHCQRIHSGKLRVQFKIWNNFHFYILSTQLSQIYHWYHMICSSCDGQTSKTTKVTLFQIFRHAHVKIQIDTDRGDTGEDAGCRRFGRAGGHH